MSCAPLSVFAAYWISYQSAAMNRVLFREYYMGHFRVKNAFILLYLLKLNSVALVCKRNIPIERQPHVGAVSANFLRIEGVTWSAQRISMAVNLDSLDREQLLFHSSRSSVILTRLSGPRSRPTTSQKISQRRKLKPGPLNL
jgi:hypothetical protein